MWSPFAETGVPLMLRDACDKKKTIGRRKCARLDMGVPFSYWNIVNSSFQTSGVFANNGHQITHIPESATSPGHFPKKDLTISPRFSNIKLAIK
jgi:hypothetical protein